MNRVVARLLPVLLAFLVLPFGATAQAADVGQVSLTVGEVDLDGPVIAPVTVTVTNGGSQRLRSLEVRFAGPVGWTVTPDSHTPKGALAPGATADLEFRIRVPENQPGFRLRTFTATATYAGGDGLGGATATRVQRGGEPLPNLAAAYNNVGVTDETNTLPGEFDSEGNSFSAPRLAAVGVVPGGEVEALGATFVWPNVPVGTQNNVAGGSPAVALTGQGGRLAFLGSASGFGSTGSVTVYYTDGTSSTGTFGFPNWSFEEATTHGATLVASSDGRNRPTGYGNAGIAYRVFANSIAIDPAKTVELVVLPGNAALHVFDMKVVD